MKKFIAVLTLSLVLAFSLVLTGCDLSGGKNNSGQNGISLDNLNSAKSVYGFSAASAGMIISSMNDEVPAADTSGTTDTSGTPDESGTTDTSGTTDESGTTDTSGGETNELDRYMGLVESLLNDDGFKIVTEESDRAEYAEKVTVSFTDIDGKDLQILIEADFIVNLYEDSASENAVRNAYEKIFVTESGKKILKDSFGL